MLRMGTIVWGTRDVPRSVEFWSAALGYRPKREPEDDWATLVPVEGEGTPISLMRVGSEHPRRHHLDLYADDVDAEVERLVGLGASRVPDWRYEDDADYVVLADPDGSRFCVCQE